MKEKITAILLCIMMLVLPTAVFAAGSASLSFSEDTEAILGGTYSVTVTFRATEDISAVQASFIYDKSKLEFLSGGNAVQASDGIGNITDNGSGKTAEYTLSFRALKTGSASLDVIDVELISANTGKRLGTPSGSLDILILEPTASQDPMEDPLDGTQTPSDDPSQGDTLPKDRVLVINGQKYIIIEKRLPDGYLLLGNQNGELLLYRSADGSMTEYRILEQNRVYSVGEQPTLPDKKTQPVLFLDGVSHDLYPSYADGIYYVFLETPEGQGLWYRYDEADRSLQQVTVENISADKPVPDDEKQRLLDVSTFVLLAGCVIAALILLIMIFRRKK